MSAPSAEGLPRLRCAGGESQPPPFCSGTAWSCCSWRTRATVWGTTSWNRDASAYTPLRFPGQYHDPETGLHHNYFRTYDPETARYLTGDPLGLSPCPQKGEEQKALPPATREPPHLEGGPILARFAKPGEEFNMVVSHGQVGPGGFGTFDEVPNQQFVRDQLAVRTDWKDDVSLLQRYRIPEGGDPILVQESIIGPQMDPKLGHLPGGASQIEIMERSDRARLIPVGPPREIPK